MATRETAPGKARADTTAQYYRGTGPRARHLHTDRACNALAGTEAVPVDRGAHDLPVCQHCTGEAAQLTGDTLAARLAAADDLDDLREESA